VVVFLFSDKRLSVLVVDDDAELCSEFKTHLEQYSQFDSILTARSGDEAINLIEQNKPDILILDLVIPVYDGLYIIDYITNEMQTYQPLIYILSIMGSVKTAQMLNDCSMVKYYSVKPVRPQTVANNLFRLIKDTQSVGVEENRYINSNVKEVSISRFAPEGLENLEWLVEEYLRKLNLQLGLISTKCTRVAIEIGVRSDKNVRLGMMDIYNQTGKFFTPSLSSTAVDRNIRSVTGRAVKNRTPVFERYFATHLINGEYHLSNSIFIWDSVIL
jgi:two-component system response regulator (stage 0 sporulation protein A)